MTPPDGNGNEGTNTNGAGDGEGTENQNQNQNQNTNEQQTGNENSNQNQSGTESGTEDVATLQKELQRTRQEAARYRTERNTDREKLQTLEQRMQGIAKALGVEGEGNPDPDALSKQLNSVQAELRQERMRNAFFTVANKHKADPDLTWAFLYSSGALNSVEGDNYAEALDPIVKQALEDRPKLRAEPIVPPKQGGDPNGSQHTERQSMNDLIRGRR